MVVVPGTFACAHCIPPENDEHFFQCSFGMEALTSWCTADAVIVAIVAGRAGSSPRLALAVAPPTIVIPATMAMAVVATMARRTVAALETSMGVPIEASGLCRTPYGLVSACA
jgi:hypothetical protein